MSSFERVALWIFVVAAIAMAFASCGLLTDAVASAGVPVSPAARESARHVDEAISMWLRDLLLFGAGTGASEGVRYVARSHGRKKAAAKGSGEAPSKGPPAASS